MIGSEGVSKTCGVRKNQKEGGSRSKSAVTEKVEKRKAKGRRLEKATSVVCKAINLQSERNSKWDFGRKRRKAEPRDDIVK